MNTLKKLQQKLQHWYHHRLVPEVQHNVLRPIRLYQPKEPLVNFIIAGTQKGGTTALFTFLKEHPHIHLSSQKEVHFFDNDKHFYHNSPNYAIYHSFFQAKKSCSVLGEATPCYMYWPSAPQRIYNYNPSMKLIMILRNPVDRAFAHWNMQIQRGYEPLSFWEAIMNERSRLSGASSVQKHRYSYIDRGFYTAQLERIWQFFPKEKTLVFKQEDLREDPNRVLDEISIFLQVPSMSKVAQRSIHSRHYEHKMDTRTKRYLCDVYRDDLRRLEKLLDWDCRSWLC